jgi:hypothetical protein
MMDFITRAVEISCLPKDIPETIVADVSHLELGQYLRASELTLPPGVKLISDANAVIAHCVAPKAEEEPKPAEAVAAEGAVGARARGRRQRSCRRKARKSRRKARTSPRKAKARTRIRPGCRDFSSVWEIPDAVMKGLGTTLASKRWTGYFRPWEDAGVARRLRHRSRKRRSRAGE